VSKQNKPCIFGCHRDATKNSEICSTCKAGLRYWDDRDHADILAREEHLQVLALRMAFKASDRKRKSRVKSASTVKAARSEARV
jgi:hypothetical protein